MLPQLIFITLKWFNKVWSLDKYQVLGSTWQLEFAESLQRMNMQNINKSVARSYNYGPTQVIEHKLGSTMLKAFIDVLWEKLQTPVYYMHKKWGRVTNYVDNNYTFTHHIIIHVH